MSHCEIGTMCARCTLFVQQLYKRTVQSCVYSYIAYRIYYIHTHKNKNRCTEALHSFAKTTAYTRRLTVWLHRKLHEPSHEKEPTPFKYMWRRKKREKKKGKRYKKQEKRVRQKQGGEKRQERFMFIVWRKRVSKIT